MIAAPSSKSAFSRQQIAALDAQFSQTIAQAQHAITDVPMQRRPPARSPDQQRYIAVMAGTPEQFLSAQGECTSIQVSAHGALVDRYLRCVITYSDGYFEQVSFPWVFRFTRRNDPFQYEDGSYHPFPMQPPPDAFALPHPFALSRAICSFYRAECAERDHARARQRQPARHRRAVSATRVSWPARARAGATRAAMTSDAHAVDDPERAERDARRQQARRREPQQRARRARSAAGR